MKKVLLSLIIAIVPYTTFADDSVFLQSAKYPIFRRQIEHILSLGIALDQYPAGSPILSRITLQRDAIMGNMSRLYHSFELGSRLTPTLDISSEFDFIIQKYKLSCEIAATKMTIESLVSRNISEDDILQSLRIDPSIYSGGIWGDPDIGFVGSITGSQMARTGYGIYEKPLEKYLQSLGFTATGSSILVDPSMDPSSYMSSLLENISGGSRVILWGDFCTTPEMEDGIVRKVDTYIISHLPIAGINTCKRSLEERLFSWKTPAGKDIVGLSGEHAFLLLGYIGNIKNPTHIIVLDTDTGRHVYPYAEWMRKWSTMQYRHLIVSIK